mmetsp:Transcript_3332/g.7526  ORF Transcript_3332/g.7526 Transcript_3332/m.7526 type:complete len:223 (+) Transcript_3332:21-689(+)
MASFFTKKKKNTYLLSTKVRRACSTCSDLAAARVESTTHAAGELHVNRVDVLSDAAHVHVVAHAALVHLLRVHTILRVKVLHLAIREHAVVAGIRLEFRSQLGRHGHALLLTRKLHHVRAAAHDGGTSRRHLEDLLLLSFPGDDVELLLGRLGEQSSGGASEDGRGRRRVERGLGPGRLLRLCLFFLGADTHGAAGRGERAHRARRGAQRRDSCSKRRHGFV